MEIRIETDVCIEMRDGCALAADVYLPANQRPVGVLLQRTPYGKELQPIGRPLDGLAAVRHGYALVVQDVRGRGRSAGAFVPFETEANDGVDTIRWIRDQPWSESGVAMAGSSYLGWCQWAAAAQQPAGLVAIAPHLSPIDPRDDWIMSNGIVQLGFVAWWSLMQMALPLSSRAADSAESRLHRREVQQAIDDLHGTYRRGLGDLAGRAGSLLSHLERWIAASRNEVVMPRIDLGAVKVPAMLVGGWFDIFLPATLEGFRQLSGRNSGTGPRDQLVIGPWSHVVSGGTFPERNYGTAAAADLLLTRMHLEFFDTAFGRSTPAAISKPSVSVFVMGADQWVTGKEFPPPGTSQRKLYLQGSTDGGVSSVMPGLLTVDVPEEAEPLELCHRPEEPVPTIGGATLWTGAAVGFCCGPMDQQRIMGRTELARYYTEPLDRDVDVVGTSHVTFWLGGATENFDLIAKLVDVHPDGRIELLVEGERRLGPRARSEPTRLELRATANRFRRGHRIGIHVTLSDWPRLELRTVPGSLLIQQGGSFASFITIPVAPDGYINNGEGIPAHVDTA